MVKGSKRKREDDVGTGAPLVEDTSRPTALHMLKPKKGRKHTVAVAVPASIVENAQSWELKAMLVGQIARALTIFSVDEIVIYEDKADAPKSQDDETVSKAMEFFARNLQYLETPQYLRRQLLPFHRDLKWVGLLSPLDAPHHLRMRERLAYREGAVLPADKAPARPKGEQEPGVWVNCGLKDPVWVVGAEIPSDVRVTVRLEAEEPGDTERRGAACPPEEPRLKMGLYWGYQVRLAKSLKAVFDECPHEGGYDLTLGTSERGEALGMSKMPKFRNLLLAFGGVGGFEEVVREELSGYTDIADPSSLFTKYINICPKQTSRTIRTEEAVMMALSVLGTVLDR